MSAIRLRDARVQYGERVLFEHLDLEVEPGEFLAVLGPNGAGKTTLLRVLLGLTELTSGTVEIDAPVGYIPQQHAFARDLPIRGRDLVQLGLDGHRFGVPSTAKRTRAAVDAALDAVGARHYANSAIGRLSGGEQQRLRVAQALVADPNILLCDEPLLSLDLSQQQVVSELIDRRRREANTAVLFVTHEINPILQYVDRVLYLVGGQWAIGAPGEVLTSERLSALYGTSVDVVEVRDRIVVIGAEEHAHHLHDHAEHLS
jgi:zinc/manganese transport system ATP-binding protein